jgi:hypothetical protein
MAVRVRLKETASMYWLKSATVGDVPPIFGRHVGTTTVIAAIAGVGPMTLDLMGQVVGVSEWLRDDLRRLDQHGVLYSYAVPVMRRRPRVWGLNKSHKAFFWTDALAKKMWETCVAPTISGNVTTPFIMLPKFRREASGAEHIWRGNYAGKVLHLLAQSEQRDIRKSAIEEFFELEHYSHAYAKILDRLQAFGLITSRYDGTERFLGFNEAHPVGPELREYILWLNRHHFPEYQEMNRFYSMRVRKNFYGRSGRPRKSKMLREFAKRAVSPYFDASESRFGND